MSMIHYRIMFSVICPNQATSCHCQQQSVYCILQFHLQMLTILRKIRYRITHAWITSFLPVNNLTDMLMMMGNWARLIYEFRVIISNYLDWSNLDHVIKACYVQLIGPVVMSDWVITVNSLRTVRSMGVRFLWCQVFSTFYLLARKPICYPNLLLAICCILLDETRMV